MALLIKPVRLKMKKKQCGIGEEGYLVFFCFGQSGHGFEKGIGREIVIP